MGNAAAKVNKNRYYHQKNKKKKKGSPIGWAERRWLNQNEMNRLFAENLVDTSQKRA